MLNAVEMSLYLSQAAVDECVACGVIHELLEFGGRLATWHDPRDVERWFDPAFAAARLAGDEPDEYAPRRLPACSAKEKARIALFYRRYGRAG